MKWKLVWIYVLKPDQKVTGFKIWALCALKNSVFKMLSSKSIPFLTNILIKNFSFELVFFSFEKRAWLKKRAKTKKNEQN